MRFPRPAASIKKINSFVLCIVIPLNVQLIAKTSSEIIPLVQVKTSDIQHYAYYPAKMGELILKGEHEALNGDYIGALTTFNKIIAMYPDRPEGYMVLNSTYLLMMLEEKSDIYQYALDDGLQRGFQNLKKIKKKSPWDILIEGAMHGLAGLSHLKKKEYFSSARKGSKAMGYFEDVEKKDSKVLEVKFALGLYKFVRSKLAEKIWLLRIFPNKKTEGIENIKTAMEKSVFMKDLSRLILVEVYRWEKEFDTAISYGEDFIKKFPNNVYVRISMTRMLREQKKYTYAIRLMEDILKTNPDIIIAQYHLAYVLQNEGKDLVRAYKMFKQLSDVLLGNNGRNRMRAYALLRMSQIDKVRKKNNESKKLYAQALALDPDLKKENNRTKDLR